jgi:Raf kinase inhibitor-like YbhB/YbcL family protein
VKLLAAMLAALLLACASDGTTLRAPPPGVTAPALTSSTTVGKTTRPAPLTLASPSFTADGSIPIEDTCDGENVSPPLTWGSAPEGTVEMAITVVDTDANGFVHWVIAVVDPAVQAISIGNVPDGAVEALNSAGTTGWTGPCPPKGSGPHHYVFTLYALTSPSGVLSSMSGQEAIDTLDLVAAVTAKLTATYERA